MPAIMTHDFFGKDAYEQVKTIFEFNSTSERNAFLLGNQGPDPLFYLVADPTIDSKSRVGDLMHHERVSELFVALKNGVCALDRIDYVYARAWLAGFVCHYLLDRTVHPLVYFWQYGMCGAGIEGLTHDDGSDVHAEIERDLDEMVLYSKLGVTISSYRPYREILKGSPEVLAAIDKVLVSAIASCYGIDIAPSTFSHAVKSFRLVQRVFYSPKGTLHKVLGGIERTFAKKDYSFYCAMAHRDRPSDTSDFDNRNHASWNNPFTLEKSNESFWDLYETSLEKVPSAIEAVLSDDFSYASAQELTHNINFSGEPLPLDERV